ncbi:serine/threonine-protein kinase [Nodularia spumigena CS-584]|jgi:serine/threonine protein kinase|uniref:serine/threonine-protein kinase n=2 Tax=Nodularia spumigena TaxID=70799 RepID=UPI00030B5CA9|nr:serine/threonine-protein kinase [Nodularia spumigena]AHJ27913.1 serine/threonine kinase [Nodularia spumigena CCY9414]MDB9381403.1 serine/threonine-protein kinase [Nodularia spumigena CS-584]MEA5526451.1 serine/threonine-protein kinase [Nodularia spumigena UHCC 0143]
MKIHCTRPNCPEPENHFPESLNPRITPEIPLYCQACGMPLILKKEKRRYQPLEALAQGGFGATFKAIDLDSISQRHCVVKRLDIKDNDPKIVKGIEEAFEREAIVLESLGDNSGNIPTLYNHFCLTAPASHSYPEKELNYLVQQYIEGEDLSEELKKKGRFSQAEILDVLKQILPVLQLIHDDKNQVIHRDIKPSNIVRERDTQKLVLIDFGAVKQVITGETSPVKSIVFGTPAYAPPEQRAKHQVYPSSDLYALAASCVELLTGQSPNKFHDTINNQWYWRKQYPQIVDENLANILDRMLLPDHRKRFQSAREVITALNEGETGITSNNQSTNSNSGGDVTTIIPSKHKALKFVLGTALFLIIIGVSIKLYPRIFQPMISFSTSLSFKDTTSGMEIQYPENWQLQEQQASPLTGWTIARIVPKDIIPSPLSPEFLINIEDLSQSETLKDYTNLAIQQIQASAKDVKILKSQSIKLHQREGYQVVYMGQDSIYNVKFKAMQVWIIDHQKAYVLTYRAEEKLYDQFLTPVEQTMIKSFIPPVELW